jgi:c(7)-type cytochrome triheme protein
MAALAAAPAPGPESPDSLPPLERTLDPESVLVLLPRDITGNADWAEALRTGLIRPRPGKGAPRYTRGDGPRFGFDFFFSGPDTSLDAWFPHSVHAEIIDCRQCHGPIVQYRGQPITMTDIFAGEFCGRCHGKVAFPVMTGCKRCHSRGPFPEAGGMPELLGSVVMARAHGDSGIAAGVSVDALPPATFPHWVHRIRFQCRACHTELFEPRAGANVLRMQDIQRGKACGVCHDGTTAFRPTLGNCQRCHVGTS